MSKLCLFLLVLLSGISGVGEAQTAPPDTASQVDYDGLLERLQKADDAFYSDDILEVDQALRDSVLAALDSLGLAEYQDSTESLRPFVEFSLDPAGKLMTYNRVEGLVIGVATDFLFRKGMEINLQGAYATASKKFRYRGDVRIPIPYRGKLELGYADRVVPYGSNRPTANWLRALVGGADEQDYHRREGGWVSLRFPWGQYGSARLGYAAGKETSVPASTDFAFIGKMSSTNAPVSDGYDRALFVSGTLGSVSETGLQVDADFRVAGGGLGGAFTYNRGDIGVAVRQYLLANHELFLDLRWARTGGRPPVQQVADMGGLSTVRGFSRRTELGKGSLAARAEILVPYDFFGWTGIPGVRDLRLQLVPWADAGRVWEGTSDRWLTSLGAGLQRYLGPFGQGAFLRLDAAFPVGHARPADVVWYLHFTRSMF